MSRRIIGNTVGTPISPAAIERKIKPVKTINGIEADQNGNVDISEEVAALCDHSTIVCEAKGETILVTDSAKAKLRGLKLYGKSTQDGTPTPENPVEIVSAGADGEIGVKVCGAQLFNNADYADIDITGAGAIRSASLIPVTAGTYTLSRTSGGINVYCRTYIDGIMGVGQNIPENTTYKMVFNKPGYIVLSVDIGATIPSVTDLMVNAGATALPFEQYKGQTLTALTPNGLPGIKVTSGGNWTDSTGQQRICDEVDYGRGKNVERLTLLTIDYVEKTDSTGKLFGITKNTLLFDGTSGNEILCDQYSHASLQAARNADYAITMYGYDIWLRNKDYATIEEFNTALAANPIKVLAPLATPIETPLSAEELAQYAALQTNYPTTTILNDAGVGMEVSYVADTKNYIDKKFTELAAAIVANP